MPLEVLLTLVIGGIASIVLLLHLLGKSARRVMSAEDARAAWHRHFPDDTVTGLDLAHDGHAALVQTEQGPGLLWAFGADTVARHLRDFDLIDAPKGLRVRFHDYTAPGVTLRLAEDERALWAEKMRPT